MGGKSHLNCKFLFLHRNENEWIAMFIPYSGNLVLHPYTNKKPREQSSVKRGQGNKCIGHDAISWGGFFFVCYVINNCIDVELVSFHIISRIDDNNEIWKQFFVRNPFEFYKKYVSKTLPTKPKWIFSIKIWKNIPSSIPDIVNRPIQ